jgi:hypothetical protein
LDLVIAALHVGVFAAALLQAATGIGFGIIAGPILLIVMGSASAVQVSILLSLFISALIVPTLRRSIDRTLLLRLTVGSMAGLPLGIYLFLNIDLDMLKFLAGLVVLFMAIVVWRSGTAAKSISSDPPAPPHSRSRAHDFATGLFVGRHDDQPGDAGPAGRVTADVSGALARRRSSHHAGAFRDLIFGRLHRPVGRRRRRQRDPHFRRPIAARDDPGTSGRAPARRQVQRGGVSRPDQRHSRRHGACFGGR